MPHCILEYSNNIIDQVDFKAFFSQIHAIMADTKEINLDQIKSRAVVRDNFYLGNGSSNNAFAYLQISMLDGRSLELRKSMGEKIFALFQEQYPRSKAELKCSITLEIREMGRETHFKL